MTQSSSQIFKIWLGTVFAVPLWWILGCNLFIYHIVTALLVVATVHKAHQQGKGLVVPPSFVLIGMTILVYVFSLIIRGIEADPMRVLASLYNLSLWIMGLMLVFALTNLFTLSDIEPVVKIFPFLTGVTGVLVIAMFFAQSRGYHSLIFPTPLYGLTKFLGHTILVENTLTLQPLYWDWFAEGNWPRFSFFSPYPTASGGVMIIFLSMLIAWARISKKVFSPVFIIPFVLTGAALLMTLSRMSVAAFATAFLLAFMIERRLFFIWVSFGIMLLILGSPWIAQFIQWMLSLREGSTLGRLALYRYSLAQLADVDWILGMGLKPREESSFAMPIGSHSTYLSLIFKTGILGVLAFAVFQASLLWRWCCLKNRAKLFPETRFFWQGLGIIFFGIGIWMMTQDIDAPQLVCFLYFSFVGLFEGFRRALSS